LLIDYENNLKIFNEKRKELLPNHNYTAVFDCRIYQTPTLEDACAQLLWRENDATKNSVSMLARSVFSHKQIDNLNRNEMQDKMMNELGVNWNDLDIKFKRGTYIKRVKQCSAFTTEELNNLPIKHKAHKNPDLVIERSIIKEINYPIFNKISNKIDVIFYDAEPKLNQ
jgi:tRNA(His) 5'-end guanylyltransferase